nr:immunoglobulin light chain junction region [Macaca mulatta]MOW58027.1 immunoglobulin light chain junction region [Macaca mulatta]MOW58066.1 immunoglobulin light chain junction region [Macaca mulatta]MOW58539.1 immunoglobulin light chain junction region [Macaca mulatta]MOW59187.1 immunoglobulin light chain junction region [Macaca mulatta]
DYYCSAWDSSLSGLLF